MKRRVVGKGDAGADNTAPPVTVGNNRIVHNNNMRQSGLSTSNGMTVPVLLIIIGALVGFTIYQNQQFEAQSRALNFDRESHMHAQEHKWKLEFDAMTFKAKTLEAQLQKAQTQNKKKTQESGDKNSHPDVTKALKMQLDHLQKSVQHRDKHAVIDKYGEGPHRLKFQLDFPPSEIPDGSGDSFIVEMAPVDLMPHSVHLFLEQASRGLLDGCSFHRNAGHVVQGGPTSNHLNPGVNVRKPFTDADLTGVSFQEYHPDFPHKKYTMGFAGRPGGPDFYVSTVDNTRNHGPGGQGSYAIKSEADPCFAKVIEGFDAVDRMQKMSVEPGGYKRMKNYVAIKSVTVLGHEE